MPPTRRHSRTTTPPVRRPRVAGLRRPSAAGSATTDHPELVDDAPELDDVPELDVPELDEAAELEDTEVLAEPEAAESYHPPVWLEPAETTETTETDEAAADTVEADAPAEETVERKPTPRSARPTGKRRTLGSSQPADLAEAEAEVRREEADPRPPINQTLVRAIGLGVAVLVLAALAIWFRGEANSQNADAGNQTLIDTARTSEVVGQVKDAIEKSLTYNYTDLDSTAKAVRDNLAGKALCEYDQLFGQVRKLAPEQKLVLTTRVVQIGTTRLEGDRAELLVMVDQTTTRADQNQTAASGAQFAVRAERQGGTWKIIQFDMLGQPLPNGAPLPQC